MIPNIYINDVSMLKMGWIRENVEFPVPESQTETFTGCSKGILARN